MKYRIIPCKKWFRAQQKVFGLFWVDCFYMAHTPARLSDLRNPITYDSESSALEAIGKAKSRDTL